MNKLYIILGMVLFLTACEPLEQFPTNIASSDTLEDYDGVLNAAYYYQLGTVTPMAVMGDFRADNAFMFEAPYTEFDIYGPGLTAMDDQFFGPLYTAAYKSILSANNVIENPADATPTQVGEAKFLRALAYFKLVRTFGDVPINLSATPSTTDQSILARRSASEVYDVIISDLEDAIAALDNSAISKGRASEIAAQALLGKVYVQQGEFGRAEASLAAVVNGADAAGVSLQENFADIFGVDNDLNSEIIFATQVSSSVVDEYGFSEFWSWSGGLDTKSLEPLEMELFDAYSEDDLRRAVTADTSVMASPKFPQSGGPDHDWIELRLADIILLYAETLNENGSSATDVLALLDPIRTRAGLAPLDPATLNTQEAVAQAIQDERRLELAFEGQRWFDLVRTGTVDAEMGETIDSRYHLFPIPVSEVLSSFGVITQNDGY